MPDTPKLIRPNRDQKDSGLDGGSYTPNAEVRGSSNLAEGFYCALAESSRGQHGAAVLAQVDSRALLTAARELPEDAALYFVHASQETVQESFRALLRERIHRPVVYFHGTTSDFLREVPIHPALLGVATGYDVFCFWDDLPAGATLVLGDPLQEEAHWTREGFLAISGGGFRATYRTTDRFRAQRNALPARIYRQLATDTQSALFGQHGQMRAGTYTPLSKFTEPVRRWHQQCIPAGANGYGEWPSSTTVTRLPETLPNGEKWPLISIVTPSFNQGQYIEETILSVGNQGYPRVEHIVMDGGSTDQTVAVLQRYKHQLAAAVSEPDRGQSNAINKGMALTTGGILTWLNSDDMLAPGALAAIGMGFHTSRADLVAGIATLRTNGKTVAHHLTSCDPGPLPLEDLLDLDCGWNAGKFFYQPEVMFTRGIWERAGGMVREDLYYSMDYDLWVRMAEAGGQIHVIGHPVAWFRIHEAQKTNAEAKFKTELQEYVDEYHRRTGVPKRSSKPAAPWKHSLRVAMLNDHGFQYGAGIAHRRLAEALAQAGHSVIPLSLRQGPGYSGDMSDLTAEEVLAAVQNARPDIVITGNLHSAGADPWQLGIVAEQFPTMAVLHDFWLLTGRCAYPNPCEKYRQGCDETCPTADEYPRMDPDKIAQAWERKQKLLFGVNQLSLLGNSEWTCHFAADGMSASGGGRPGRPVEGFRLSFPLDVFRPHDRSTCRAVLGLPEDRFVVLLSGDLYDPRKNTQLALDALASLDLPDLTVVSLGQKRDNERFPFDDIRRLGHISDPHTLARLYAAADIYIAPSREETFGQVFIESIACGTPVIGVRASGMQEAVVDGLTGLLVDEFQPEALAAAIYELYRKPERRQQMGQWGRIYVENEWSPQAAYYHLFRAWRRLGLLEKLSVPQKIGFPGSVPEVPECRSIHASEGSTIVSATMGPEEGPHPEHLLPRFRWAYGPVSETRLRVSSGGPHSVVLRYRNVQPDQRLNLSLNGAPLGSFALPLTGLKSGRVLCVKADVQSGENTLRLEFSKWADEAREGRPMALAITELRFLPELPRN